MSLRNGSAERILWRRIRKEIKQSKKLRKEFKASKRSTQAVTSALGWISLLIYPLIAISLMSKLNLGIEEELMFASILSLAVAFGIASGFSTDLFASPDAMVLAHYPMSDDAFIKHQTRRVFRRSSALAIIIAGLYIFEGLKADFNIYQWILTLSLCTVHAIITGCLAVVLVWFRPFIPWGRFSLFISIALFASIFTIAHFPAHTIALWKWVNAWPSSWINQAFKSGVMEYNLYAFLPVLTSLLLIPASRWCLRLMSDGFETGSHLFNTALTAEQYKDLVDQTDELNPDLKEEPELPLVFESVDCGRPGWIERWVSRTLSEREKVIAEFLTSSSSFWTAHWKTSMLFVCVGLLGPALGPIFKPAWLLLAFVIIGFARAVPVGGGTWYGITPARLGNVCQAPMMQYPLGYRETTRLMLKINLLRIAAWLPGFLIIPLIICWRLELPMGTGLRISAVTLYSIAAFQVFVTGFQLFDKVGARNMRPVISLISIPLLLIGLITGLSGIAAMIMTPWWAALIGAVAYILPGFVIRAWFGFLFNHPKTDLFYPVPNSGG